MIFIRLGEKSYATPITSSMVGSFFAEMHQTRVRLPHDAIDTGFRFDGTQLWLSANGQRAFLGQPGQRFVAMLPRMIQPLLCS